MISFDLVLTLVVIGAMTLALAFEVSRAELIVFISFLVFIVSGILSPAEAFKGFANEGLLSVAFLYVVAAGLESTGVLSSLGPLLLGKKKQNISITLSRFLFPVASASAFLNNTPLVSMLIPTVKRWARRVNVSPAKLLLPLSYAAILGGMCTLIGTSTNLVVHGLMLERGMAGFSFFELARVGVPASIVGLLLIIVILHRWLPDRKETLFELGTRTREFVVEMKVNRSYQGIAQTIESAGLRHLRGLFLFQIERDGQLVAPVQPTERIRVNDRLFFTGVPATIVELQKQKGLDVIKDFQFDVKNYDSDRIRTYEVVISESSPLKGKTVRESNFRGRYDAAILAIHRSGERVEKKIGDVELQPGDTLLILAPKEFYERWYHSRDFFLVSSSEQVPSKPRWKVITAVTIVVAMVTAVTAGIVPMVLGASIAAVLLVVTRTVSMDDAMQSVNWGTLLVIASGLGIARALENSGVANLFAGYIAGISSGNGMLLTIAVMYFATVLYTEFVSNNAAAAMMFPIALATAVKSSMAVMPLVYAVVIGASAGFAMPIGYQTNLMVYGPGGYRFTDYLKVGIPMDLIVGATVVTAIYFVFS